jgi:hypothetical protein
MKGIKMSDCRFYVNEAERTVVCVIPQFVEEGNWRNFTSDMVTDFISDNFTFSEIDFDYAMESKLKDKLKMPNTFMGKAVCSPDDEWNEEVGKMIAFSRAKDKCYKSFFRRANHFIQTIDRRLNDMIECFNNFGLQLEDKHLRLENKINELVDKKENGDA